MKGQTYVQASAMSGTRALELGKYLGPIGVFTKKYKFENNPNGLTDAQLVMVRAETPEQTQQRRKAEAEEEAEGYRRRDREGAEYKAAVENRNQEMSRSNTRDAEFAKLGIAPGSYSLGGARRRRSTSKRSKKKKTHTRRRRHRHK